MLVKICDLCNKILMLEKCNKILMLEDINVISFYKKQDNKLMQAELRLELCDECYELAKFMIINDRKENHD